MKKAMSYLAMGAALYTVTVLPSCSSEDDAPLQNVNEKKTGTLSMNLQQSVNGRVYRLRQAVFPITPLGFATGSGGQFSDGVDFPVADAGFPAGGSPGTGGIFGVGGFFAGGSPGTGGIGTGGIGTGGFFPDPGGSVITLNSEDDPNSLTLEAFLVPSFYQIQLLDGWFMEQVDNLLGTSTIVPAQLVSGSFQVFNIESNFETFVQFVFLVDGRQVSFGTPGRLRVGIEVIEQSCGDGIVGPGESCDSGDFLGQDCASATFGQFPLGFLQCSPFCQIDTSFCFSDGGAGGSPIDGGAGGPPIFQDGGFGGGSGGFGGVPGSGGQVSGGGKAGGRPTP